jgi:predicted amidohydrolase
MKICVAQTRPVKADVAANIVQHKNLVSFAVAEGAGLVVFPELSLTGYEPRLAGELAMEITDTRLNVFQELSDLEQIGIGVGIPQKARAGILITMVLFQPGTPRQSYSKQFLHSDERPYFITAEQQPALALPAAKIAIAICYESSVPGHTQAAAKAGAVIYIASIAKSAAGAGTAITQLSSIAKRFGFTVLMSNGVGECDGIPCGGRSFIWNTEGLLMGQLDSFQEGILLIDTQTQQTIKRIL